MVTTRKHDEETGEGGKQQEQQQQKEEGHATKKAKGGEEEESQGGQGGQGGQEEGAAKSKMPEEEERGEGEEEEEEEEEEEGVGEEKQQEGVGEEEQQEGQAEKETTAAAKGQKVAQETKKGKGSRGKTTKSALGLEIGSPAPEFALPNEQGETVALKDFKGKHVAIYFYNKDDTPVVTKGGMAFAKVFPEMQKMGVPLLFIGPDSVQSHKKFKEKAKLPFTLLSDSKKEVARAFHNLRGRSVLRTTVLVDPEGKILNVFADIPESQVDQNPVEALEFMKSTLTQKVA